MTHAPMQPLTGLSLLAGAVHVLAPDHWVPSSVLAWRRRWLARGTAAFAAGVLSAHVAAGFVLYWILSLAEFRGNRLFLGTLAFVGLLGLLRVVRFSRVRGVLRSPPGGLLWGVVSVISIIGPAESLVPILVRAHEVGASLAFPLAAFWVGTLASGVALGLAGPWIWDRPLLMPQGLAWAERRRTAIPIAMGVAIAATFLLR